LATTGLVAEPTTPGKFTSNTILHGRASQRMADHDARRDVSRESLVVLTHATHRPVGLSYFSCVVCRTIINHDDFDIGIGLKMSAVDRFAQEMTLVVARIDNRY